MGGGRAGRYKPSSCTGTSGGEFGTLAPPGGRAKPGIQHEYNEALSEGRLTRVDPQKDRFQPPGVRVPALAGSYRPLYSGYLDPAVPLEDFLDLERVSGGGGDSLKCSAFRLLYCTRFLSSLLSRCELFRLAFTPQRHGVVFVG